MSLLHPRHTTTLRRPPSAPLFAVLALLTLVFFSLVGPIPVSAALQIGQVRKLNDGPIAEARLSPDGAYALFLAQQQPDLRLTLESVAFTGGASVPLSPEPITEFGNLLYEITADSARVVVLARPSGNDVPDLYSIPIGGGPATHLATDLPANTTVSFFRITPDSQTVLFQAVASVGGLPGPSELFAIPVSGGSAPRRLNAPLAANETVRQWELSKDGSDVVYLAGLDGGAMRLESALVAGGAPTTIDSFNLPFGVPQVDFKLSADGSRVVYQRPISLTEAQLFTAVTTSAAPTAVSAPGDANSFAIVGITPDNSRVVYAAGPLSGTEGIYSAPLGATGTFITLTGGLAPDSSFGGVLSPDGARVLVSAFSDATRRTSLSSIAVTGGAPFLIEPQLPSGGGISLSRITPDSARIVYREDRQFYSVPIAGGSRVLIADEMDAAGTSQLFLLTFTADGKYMIFRGKLVGEPGYPLFITPVAEAGGLQRLSGQIVTVAGPPVSGGGAVGFSLDSTGGRAIFQGTSNPSGGTMALYAVETGTQSGSDPSGKRLYLPLLRR